MHNLLKLVKKCVAVRTMQYDTIVMYKQLRMTLKLENIILD